MADSASPSPENPTGFWEQWEIVALHDRILAHFGLDWTTPHRLPVAWWTDPFVRERKEEIKVYLTARIQGSALYGFKDPRTATLLPMWFEILEELNVSPKFVVCIREPGSVARSIIRSFSVGKNDICELMWLHCNLSVLYYLGNRSFTTIIYDNWYNNIQKNMCCLSTHVFGQSEVDQHIVDAVVDIIIPDLRQSDPPCQSSKIASKLYSSWIRRAEIGIDDPDLRRWAADMLEIISIMGRTQAKNATYSGVLDRKVQEEYLLDAVNAVDHT